MKPVVSSLVALVLAIAPMSAYAAKPVHGRTAHISKDSKDSKSEEKDEKIVKTEKSEKSEKSDAIVRVKAGKKDGAAAKPAIHHAHNVNLEGAGHKEPGVASLHKASTDGSLVSASMVTKTTTTTKHEKSVHSSKLDSKELPKLPDPKAGKPSKGGGSADKGAQGAHKAASKKSESASSDDGETMRDEVTAELVARIRGQKSADENAKVVSKVLHEEPAPSKSVSAQSTTRDSKKHASDDDAVVEKEETLPPAKPEKSAKEEPSTKEQEPSAHEKKGTKNAHGSVKPCSKDPVEIVRGPEIERFMLTKCDGSPAPLAIEHLSVLIRPGGTARPTAPFAELAKKDGKELAHGIRRADPKLVERIQALADHFGKAGAPAKLSIISGYRPASVGSMHSSGRAIDFRIEGVKNEDVVAFCKTLDDTGCGFYPNSSFVHVDVRDANAGHVSWIDASGPGETPRYVAAWPEPGSSAAKKGLERTSIVTIDPLAEEGAELLKAKRPADLDPPTDGAEEHPSSVK